MDPTRPGLSSGKQLSTAEVMANGEDVIERMVEERSKKICLWSVKSSNNGVQLVPLTLLYCVFQRI